MEGSADAGVGGLAWREAEQGVGLGGCGPQDETHKAGGSGAERIRRMPSGRRLGKDATRSDACPDGRPPPVAGAAKREVAHSPAQGVACIPGGAGKDGRRCLDGRSGAAGYGRVARPPPGMGPLGERAPRHWGQWHLRDDWGLGRAPKVRQHGHTQHTLRIRSSRRLAQTSLAFYGFCPMTFVRATRREDTNTWVLPARQRHSTCAYCQGGVCSSRGV